MDNCRLRPYPAGLKDSDIYGYALVDENGHYVASKYLLVKKGSEVVATRSKKYITDGFYYFSTQDKAEEELRELNAMNEKYQLNKEFSIKKFNKKENSMMESKECESDNFYERKAFFRNSEIITPL